MPYKRIGKTVYKKLPNGKLKSVGVSDSVDLAKAHLRALYAAETNESLTEGLSPEVSKKAAAIFKSMIADKRDSLFKRYGADAEKVAYGHAIAKAKQINEKQTMQQTDKLREMVRAALSAPIGKTNTINEDDWKQPNDESDMAKSQLYNLIKDAQRLESMIVDGEQLDAWVQAKLTKAQDYINSVHEYLCSEQSSKKHVDIDLTEHIFNRIKNRM